MSEHAVVIAGGGPGTSHDHYHPWFSRLTPELRVVYFDYSGCGRSDALPDPGAYAVSVFAENIEAVLGKQFQPFSPSAAKVKNGALFIELLTVLNKRKVDLKTFFDHLP